MTQTNQIHQHEYDPNSFSAASPYCAAMVERDGGGDQCGLLRDDPAHLMLTGVVQTLDGVQHIGVLPLDAAVLTEDEQSEEDREALDQYDGPTEIDPHDLPDGYEVEADRG